MANREGVKTIVQGKSVTEWLQENKDAIEVLGRVAAVTMSLSGPEMFALLGALQLVLRHEGFVGYPRDVAHGLAMAIEVKICEIAPALSALCSAGWNAEFDI